MGTVGRATKHQGNKKEVGRRAVHACSHRNPTAPHKQPSVPVLDGALRVEAVQDGVCVRGQLAGVQHQLVVLRQAGRGGERWRALMWRQCNTADKCKQMSKGLRERQERLMRRREVNGGLAHQAGMLHKHSLSWRDGRLTRKVVCRRSHQLPPCVPTCDMVRMKSSTPGRLKVRQPLRSAGEGRVRLLNLPRYQAALRLADGAALPGLLCSSARPPAPLPCCAALLQLPKPLNLKQCTALHTTSQQRLLRQPSLTARASSRSAPARRPGQGPAS